MADTIDQSYVPEIAGLVREFVYYENTHFFIIVIFNYFNLLCLFAKNRLYIEKINFRHYNCVFFLYEINK